MLGLRRLNYDELSLSRALKLIRDSADQLFGYWSQMVDNQFYAGGRCMDTIRLQQSTSAIFRSIRNWRV